MIIRRDVPLAGLTTLGVGGPARFLVEARTEAEIAEALAFAAGEGVETFVLGGGSNLLVADAGFPGLVLRVGLSGVSETVAGGETLVRAGAGEDWDALVARCVARGLGGIECLSGIPGRVGGTPVQNVGAYGQEIAPVVRAVRVLDRASGAARELAAAECAFGYRSSVFNSAAAGRYIVLEVTLALSAGAAPVTSYRDVADRFPGTGPAPTLASVREAVLGIRRAKGMLLVPGEAESRSAGSFFKNPVVSQGEFLPLRDAVGPDLPGYPEPGGGMKIPAARLIERAGFARGYRKGEAAISSRHTLALVNLGRARAADIVDLAREIRDRVRERFGVTLVPEPVFLGFEEAL